MQLDKTRIAVRERGIPEVLDLSLHVMRSYGGPVLMTLACGVLPLMLLNELLVGWMLNGVEYGSTWAPEEIGAVIRYIAIMALLVIVEAQLGCIFATSYLGQAVFHEQPSIWSVIRRMVPLTPQLVWCHLIVRGVLPTWVLVVLIDRESDFSGWEMLLILLTLIILAIRAFRPYINEIIILEQLPLTKGRAGEMTIGRRSNALHGPAGGDLIARWLVASFVAVLLAFGVYGVLLFLSGVLLNQWRPTPFLLHVCLPLSFWIVAGFLCVFRFLSYLDLRIRHEGWEVELRLRAEASRILSKMV